MYLQTALEPFDPAKVTIERVMHSATQWQVQLLYDGELLGGFGSKPVLVEGRWIEGEPMATWVETAQVVLASRAVALTAQPDGPMTHPMGSDMFADNVGEADELMDVPRDDAEAGHSDDNPEGNPDDNPLGEQTPSRALYEAECAHARGVYMECTRKAWHGLRATVANVRIAFPSPAVGGALSAYNTAKANAVAVYRGASRGHLDAYRLAVVEAQARFFRT